MDATDLRKAIQPQLNAKHDKYGYAPPPPPDGIREVSGDYFRHAMRRRRTLLSRPRTDSIKMIPEYEAMLDNLVKFLPFFDEYDTSEVIPSVTAMNLKKATHSDLDEGAPLRLNRNHILDKGIVDLLVNQWSTAVAKVNERDLKLTLPTQTNLGWPFLMSKQGNLRPFTLGAIALACARDKELGLSLSAVYEQLAAQFGAPLIFQGSRLQHTAKIIPFMDGNGFSWTKNFEPRYRAIFMGSKIGICWNRQATKKLLKAAMSLKQHDQRRPFIQQQISKWVSDPSKQVIAVDVSKFDKAHGSHYLADFAKIAGRILHDQSIEKDFLAEVSMPLVVYSGNSIYTTTDAVAPQLPSGVSFTTIAGLFFGDYICHQFAKTAGLPFEQRGTTWDYLNWGDDVILVIPKTIDRKLFLEKATRNLDIETTQEPVVRYLGFNYANGSISTNIGYSVGRMVLKHFFPERPKAYPFSVIGYVARLKFIPDAKRFHEFMLRHGWNDTLGEPFSYADSDGALAKALQATLTLDEYDTSTLDFLLHGLEPTEASELLDPLGIDFDFTDWIGHSQTDFTDPLKTLQDLDAPLFTESKTLIGRIQNSGSLALSDFGNWIAGRWHLQRAGVIF